MALVSKIIILLLIIFPLLALRYMDALMIVISFLFLLMNVIYVHKKKYAHAIEVDAFLSFIFLLNMLWFAFFFSSQTSFWYDEVMHLLWGISWAIMLYVLAFKSHLFWKIEAKRYTKAILLLWMTTCWAVFWEVFEFCVDLLLLPTISMQSDIGISPNTDTMTDIILWIFWGGIVSFLYGKKIIFSP